MARRGGGECWRRGGGFCKGSKGSGWQQLATLVGTAALDVLQLLQFLFNVHLASSRIRAAGVREFVGNLFLKADLLACQTLTPACGHSPNHTLASCAAVLPPPPATCCPCLRQCAQSRLGKLLPVVPREHPYSPAPVRMHATLSSVTLSQSYSAAAQVSLRPC